MSGDAVFGALTRSLAELTLGQRKAAEDRQKLDDVLAGSDMTQNLQIPCGGSASRAPVWTKTLVLFPYPFLNNIDRTRTDSELVHPHFTYGVEIHSDANVIITTQIREWIEDPDTGWMVGAQVRVCAWCPQARKNHRWTGVIHLSFTGYGAPAEEETGA